VILADTTTKPTGPRDPRLMALSANGGVPGAPNLLVWTRRQADDTPAIAATRLRVQEAAQAEYRRLLYVGMTRAAERLVICGYQGLVARPKDCWYDLVCDALWEQSAEEPADDGGEPVRRFRKGIAAGHAASAAPYAAQQAADPAAKFPDWLERDAPAAAAVLPLAPSAAAPRIRYRRFRGREEAEDSAIANAKALTRGRLVHRLMQALPDIAPDRHETAARRFIDRNGRDFTADEGDAMLAQVLTILRAPHFAPLFAPGSRGEVPIVGRIERADLPPLIVNGQVDRLALAPDAVLIADYKTDRPTPRIAPPGYVTQLALYRAVLAKLYPGRTVRAALIWMEGPELMELSAQDLDRALGSVTSA
jgi:ATP-dependent helicase/nuclease subunit A